MRRPEPIVSSWCDVRAALAPRLGLVALALLPRAPVRRRAALAADRGHVLAVATHRSPSLPTGDPRLLDAPLVRGSLAMSGAAALARDLLLALWIHRRKAAGAASAPATAGTRGRHV